MATKKEIIDKLSQCGGLSYNDWILLLDSIYFDGDLNLSDVFIDVPSTNILPTPTQDFVSTVLLFSGTYTWGSNSYVIPNNYLGYFTWNGTTWTLKTKAMPTPVVSSKVVEGSTDAVSGDAVFKHVKNNTVALTHGKNFFNPYNSKIGELLNTSGGVSKVNGWAWSGLIDISELPDGSFIYLSSNKNRVGAVFFPASVDVNNPQGGRYISTPITGVFQKMAGDKYFGFNLYSPTENAYTWAQLEAGNASTAFEEYKNVVPISSVNGLSVIQSNASTALTKSTANEEKLSGITRNKLFSRNYLDPSRIVPDSLLVLSTGAWLPNNPTYNGFEIDIPENTAFTALKQNNTVFSIRQICFINASGSVISYISTSLTSFTSPAGTVRARGAILKTQVPDFNTAGIFKTGETWEKFGFYNDYRLTNQQPSSDKNDESIATIKDIKSLSSSSASSNKQIRYTYDSNGYLFMYDKEGNSVAGQTQNDGGFERNSMFNFMQSLVKGVTVGSLDDVAPIHMVNTTIGANHGWNHYVATIANHGMDNTFIGREFTKGGVKFYPIRIVDSNNVAFVSENSGSYNNWVFTPLTVGQIDLGATPYNITAVATKQTYPSIGLNRIKTHFDGFEVPKSSNGYANEISVAEDYEIFNFDSVLNNIKARAGQNLPPLISGDSMCKVRNVYKFERPLCCIVTAEVYFNQVLPFADIMGNQAVRISGEPYYYLPNSSPIGGVDLRKPYQIPVSSSNPSIFVKVNNLDATHPPDRIIMYSGNVGFMLAYLPEYNDYNRTLNLFEIRGNSGKIYPHPIEGSKVGATTAVGDNYSMKLVRVYVDLSIARTAQRLSYFVVPNGKSTLIYIDYSAQILDDVFIEEPLLNGKSVTVLHSRNTTLISKTFNNGVIIDAKYTDGETSFIILKVE